MTSTDLSIRDARQDERAAMRDVTLAAYQQYEQTMPPQLWEGYRSNIVKTLERDDGSERIVAERAGHLAGSILYYPVTAQAYGRDEPTFPWPIVRLLAVAPAERGNGIGAALMAECEHRARQAGAPALGLHTTDLMEAAIRLYQRLGFVRVPEYDVQPAPGLVVKAFKLSLN